MVPVTKSNAGFEKMNILNKTANKYEMLIDVNEAKFADCVDHEKPT